MFYDFWTLEVKLGISSDSLSTGLTKGSFGPLWNNLLVGLFLSQVNQFRLTLQSDKASIRMAAGLIPKWRLVPVHTKTSSEESIDTIKNSNPGILVIENKYRYLSPYFYPLFTESALRPIQSVSCDVRMYVCLFVCLSVPFCSLRLNVFLHPLPKVQCPNFLDFRNTWGKVMERSGLRFENCCSWRV